MKAFTIPTVFTAVDRFSGPVNKMTESMDKMEKKINNVGAMALNVAKKSAMVGAAILAPVGLLVNEAIKFEDKMADVAKVANVKIGSQQFDQIATSAKQLGIFLGVGAIEAAELMQNLAQGGVAISDLDQVAKIAGKVGVAFGISADMAGEAFIKTRNALGGTIESTSRLMDAINHLGNTTAASSAQIITFMSNGGSAVARAMGASGESVAAVAAQLISMGTSAEESATVMERFTKQVMMNQKLRAVFDRAGGGAEGMMAVIKKGADLSGKAQDEFFQQFGAYGLKLQLLAKNYDQLKDKVDSATDSFATLNSVNAEFNNRTATTAFKLEQAKARFNVLAIELGSVLLPEINKLIERLTPVIEKFTAWIRRNRAIVAIIMKAVAVIGALSFAISAISMVVVSAVKAYAAYNFVIGAMTAANILSSSAIFTNTAAMSGFAIAMKLGIFWTKAVTAATWLWNAALAANPIGLVIVALGALGIALAYVESKYKSIAQLHNESLQKERTKAFQTETEAVKKAAEAYVKYGKSQSEANRLAARDAEQYLKADKQRIEQKIAATTDEKQLRILNLQMANIEGRQKAIEAINPQETQQNAMREIMQTNNARVDLNINDPNNRVSVASPSRFVNIITTPTTGNR